MSSHYPGRAYRLTDSRSMIRSCSCPLRRTGESDAGADRGMIEGGAPLRRSWWAGGQAGVSKNRRLTDLEHAARICGTTSALGKFTNIFRQLCARHTAPDVLHLSSSRPSIVWADMTACGPLARLLPEATAIAALTASRRALLALYEERFFMSQFASFPLCCSPSSWSSSSPC